VTVDFPQPVKRPLEGLLFLAPIFPMSVIVTWLFMGTGGSVPR